MTADRPAPPDDGDDLARAEFLAAIGPVRRLPDTPLPPSTPKPKPRAHMAQRDEDDARISFRRALADHDLLAGDAMRYRRDEVPQRVLLRLSRGEYAAVDELDLHHADIPRAEALLREFLRHARDAGSGCVRIIHGKGLHAPDGVATLKNVVDRILRQRSDVLAFHSAPAAQGGTGAVLVLLRPR